MSKNAVVSNTKKNVKLTDPYTTTWSTLSDISMEPLSISTTTVSPTYTISSTPSTNSIWNTTVTGSSYNWADLTTDYSTRISQSGQVQLKGKDADIDINGKSLKTWMEKVEERLNLLTPNPELEQEWDELRELGQRYRELEKQCKEKAEVWNKLKQMSPKTE